jgi:stage II sporulation SpoE-like protein/GAF domain-containing protein
MLGRMRHAADETALLERLADPERLDALRRLQLLDTPAERVFERLTQFTARELGVPVVLISLVTDDRQFFKSACGLPAPWNVVQETPLSYSFCQYVVAQDEAMIIVDTFQDGLLRMNDAVTEIGVRAYAGFPLHDDAGHVFGSFCALDIEPRTWVPHELEFLRDMAAVTMDIIELRTEAVAATEASSRLQRVLVPAPPPLRRGRAYSAYRPGERRLLLGGDFFVCAELDDGTLGLMMGDVVGHGPEAAGFAAGLRSAWVALELTDGPPEELAATLNQVALTLGSAKDRYASAIFCRVSPERDRAEVLVAGHPQLVVIDGDGARELPVPSGPPLGVLETADWATTSVDLPPGASLLLYTDGLTEARAPDGQRVGIERVLSEADRLTHEGYGGDELLAGLLALADGEQAPDDIALLLVRLD